MIILHNENSKDSRDFVSNYGEGHDIIDWYNESQREAYKLSGNPSPRGFPYVVYNGEGHFNPESIQWVKDEYNGLHKTVEQLAIDVRKKINDNTDYLIVFGFTWNSKQFLLTPENQRNYEFKVNQLNNDESLLGTEDAKIKGAGNTYHTFSVLSTVNDFYNSALTHIQSALKFGWILKDGGTYDGTTYTALVDQTKDDLLNFTDPRM